MKTLSALRRFARAVVLVTAALSIGCQDTDRREGNDGEKARPVEENDCAPYGVGCKSDCDTRGTRHSTKAPARRAPDATLSLALRVFTAWSTEAVDAQAFADFQRAIIEETNAVLEQCGIATSWEEGRVVLTASSSLTLLANLKTSKAGFAPAGADSAQFHYALAERVPPPTLDLLRQARAGLAKNTITVNLIDNIVVHRDGEPARVGGYAFIPTTYHHQSDFPARNATLVSSGYPQCGQLPTRPAPRVVAHELGHMLLDEPEHHADTKNLMSRISGPALTDVQCQRMRETIRFLYGKDAKADPGPPAERTQTPD